MAPKAKRETGVSVVKLLVVAAVLGVVSGVVLSRAGRQELEMNQVASKVVNEALPATLSLPLRETPDMMAPDPISLRGIPPYPGARPRKIVGARPGAPVNAVSWFATDDSVDRVLSYYEGIYTKNNVLYASHRWAQKSGYVSWFEHARPLDGGLPEFGEGTLHMISAYHDAATTTVLVSASDPMAILKSMSNLPAGISLPPGAAPQVINVGEPGQQRYSIFSNFPMTREALAQDLEQRMAAEGFRLTERAVAPDGRVTLVAKTPTRVQIAVIDGTPTGSQVLITLEEK